MEAIPRNLGWCSMGSLSGWRTWDTPHITSSLPQEVSGWSKSSIQIQEEVGQYYDNDGNDKCDHNCGDYDDENDQKENQ